MDDRPAGRKSTHPSRKRKPSSKQGKDELNLATIPLSVLTHQQPTDTERKLKHYSRTFAYTVYDDQAKQWVPAKVTLMSNPKHGLPTPVDESLFLALFNLALEADHQVGQRFEFVPSQLFKLMNKHRKGDSYNQLAESLRRLKSVSIFCEYAWYDLADHHYEAEYSFGLIGDYKLNRAANQGRRKSDEPKSFIVFDSEIHRQLTSGVLKPLDLAFYFSLKLPTSRRMYRTLDRHFYKRAKYSADLGNFARGNLGVSGDYNTGQLKRTLNPAINELVMANFIQPADPSERYTKVKKGIWRINFEKVPHAKRKPAAKLAAKPQPVSSIAQQLIDRGIKQPVAIQLAKDHSEADINIQVDAFDWYNAKRDSKQHKQPGWLIKAITDNYDHSKLDGFKTREQRQATRQLAAEKKRKEHAAEAKRRADEKATHQRTAKLDKLWHKQTEQIRQDILQHVLGDNQVLRGLHAKGKGTSLIHEACLSELEKRQTNPAA